MKINAEVKELIKKYIRYTENSLLTTKIHLEESGLSKDVPITYKETLEAIRIRKELEQIFLNDDSDVSSSKFSQKKLF